MKVNVIAGVAGSLALCAAASAGFTGLSVEDMGGGVWRLYANFDDAGDTIVNVFNANVTTVEGWNQNDGGSGWLPFPGGGADDSFVTIGAEPGFPPNNATTLDPNFDPAGVTSLGTNAGWFNSNPPNNQGNAGADGKVLLAQFAYLGAIDTEGNLELTYTTSAGETLFGEGGFIIIPAPGALALLGLAGLAGTRRRRG